MHRDLTARGKERRRQLMAHAAHRFAENGYDPTSVADIVHGMGVGKGVFYWYFSSKEELFCEILQEAQQALRRRQRQAIGAEPDPLRRIELGIRASLSWLYEHRDLFTLFQFAASDERFGPALRRGQDVAVSDAARHITDAIIAGRIPEADPLMLSQAVLGVTNSLARNFMFAREAWSQDMADAAVAFCLGGLAGWPRQHAEA